MNKGLAITGGAFLFVSLFVIVVSFFSVLDYRPTTENILHDTSKDGTSFEYDGSSIPMEVYAIGNLVNCDNFNLTITGYMGDIFLQDCVSGTDYPGYTYLGDIVDTAAAGNYTITAEENIVIVDASEIIVPAFGMCGGSVCCLLGLLLLLVSLVTGKKTPQVVLYQQPGAQMYQPNQTTVQQYVPAAPSGQQQQIQPVIPSQQPSQGFVPIHQTEFEGFSFEHKKDD